MSNEIDNLRREILNEYKAAFLNYESEVLKGLQNVVEWRKNNNKPPGKWPNMLDAAINFATVAGQAMSEIDSAANLATWRARALDELLTSERNKTLSILNSLIDGLPDPGQSD